MKTSFKEEQILDFLKQAEAAVPIKELRRRHGFSEASLYTWHPKFGGMTAPDAKRLEDLALENSGLKELLAEAHLDIEALEGGRHPDPERIRVLLAHGGDHFGTNGFSPVESPHDQRHRRRRVSGCFRPPGALHAPPVRHA